MRRPQTEADRRDAEAVRPVNARLSETVTSYGDACRALGELTASRHATAAEIARAADEVGAAYGRLLDLLGGVRDLAAFEVEVVATAERDREIAAAWRSIVRDSIARGH